MVFHKTRLSTPGFAFLLLLLGSFAVSAKELKPSNRFNVTVPDSYSYEDPGPFGISYLSSGKVAVWFTDNTRGELSRRDKLQPTDPWRMKLQVFDTSTGAVDKREYPTHKLSTGLQVQADGTIIMLNGPLVRCLAPDFRQTGSVNLPEPLLNPNERVVVNSPGGRFVWAFESAHIAGAWRIDGRSCTLTERTFVPGSITSLSANDNLILATDDTHIATRRFKTDWTSIYRADPCCVSGAYFANQSDIVAYRVIPAPRTVDEKQGSQPADPKRSLLFLDTQGKVLLEEPLETGYEAGPIVQSSTGKYVLIAMPKPDFSSDLFQYRLLSAKYRVWIYDLSTMKRVADFEVNRNKAPLFSFAFSPDARQVAVLEGNRVAIYDIPHQP